MIPNGNKISDCDENLYFRLLQFVIFGPKKAKSWKLMKHALEHPITIVDTEY